MEVVKPQISIDQNVKNMKIEEKTINKDAVSILRLTPKYKRSKIIIEIRQKDELNKNLFFGSEYLLNLPSKIRNGN